MTTHKTSKIGVNASIATCNGEVQNALKNALHYHPGEFWIDRSLMIKGNPSRRPLQLATSNNLLRYVIEVY